MEDTLNTARGTAEIYVEEGLLLDFFRFLFPQSPENGHYQVTSTNLVGEMMTHLAQPTVLPVTLGVETGMQICVLDIPSVDGLPRGGWLQYSRSNILRINHILNAYFDLDFYRYYMKGIQYGYEKQETVESYVISRNLAAGEPFDTLHKRVYRKQMDIMKQRVTQLQRKAKYFFDESDPTTPTLK